MKDYIKDYQPEDEFPEQKLRSVNNPTGHNRRNRLNRDFDSDISVRRDQAVNRFKENDESGEAWEPHDYI